jgi:hypothetical protein
VALDTVQELISLWPGGATLDLDCGDELSEQGSGIISVKELRPPLWVMRARSRLLTPTQVKEWKARLNSLENGKRLFWGWDKTGEYPIAHPCGAWPTGGAFNGLTATIASIGANNKSLSVDLLPAGFAGAVGDWLGVTYGTGPSYGLYQVMEPYLANGSGVTGVFEVRPHLRPGTAVDNLVAVKRPAAQMMIQPGSVSSDVDDLGWGTITFSALQVI